ncbi:MAG: hypothetical protein SOW31_10770 [Treponema sp.]|nr:hypothetical protein [Treponema sp.]MCI5666608.1 hypothetical protein [Spirochaetia bacterium]MDD7768479.1 hypothetical protein [Treponema sp.]MDY3132199.1 hypothetical protein [Treponema sp.]
MKVVEIKDIQREEGQIFYIRKYSGEIFIELPTSTEHGLVKFSIEMDPLGRKSIVLLKYPQLNYPLLPLKKAIIDFILSEETEGRLPC